MKAKPIALGGVLGALAVVFLTLGGMVPMAIYVCPMLASILLIPLLEELPKTLCVGWYAVVSLLAGLLCPDKETAFVFVFLGWYPVAKPGLDRMPKPFRLPCKLFIFNAAVAALYGLLILVFQMEALASEAKEMGLLVLVILLALGNLTFLLFDVLLVRLTLVYKRKRYKEHKK